METVNLGKSGLKISRLCLGMMTYGTPGWRKWVLDEKQALPFIEHALEAGINFFDTADVYSLGGSEEVLGSTLKTLKVKRENVVIATKVCSPISDDINDRGLSRKHILDSIDRSLHRLKMDYVDLYQIHRWDPATPIEESLDALNDVVRSGKVRYLGASSMFAWQFAKAQYTADLHGWTRFISMQNHYNLIYREEEREMIPFCVDQGIGIIPWSPLARGFFAAGRSRTGDGESLRSQTDDFAKTMYWHEENFAIAERANEVARKHHCSGSQIALAWLLNKVHISAPIIGASKLEHLDQAVAALEIKLAQGDIDRLEEFYRPHPVLGHS